MQLNKNTWLIVIATVFILLVWLVVIVPAIGRLQRTVQTITDVQTTQFTNTRAVANLISALQRKNELIEDSAIIKRLFIDRTNPIVFISRLEELAADYAVTLDLDIKQPTADPVTTPIASAGLGIRVSGQWQSVLGFVNALYAEPLALRTEKFSISTPSDTPDIIQVDITTLAYWH